MLFQRFRVAVTLLAGSMAIANGQWLNFPDPRTPRTKDGKPNLSARTPRVNGRPDLSGVWHIEPPAPGEIERIYGDVGAAEVVGDDARLHSRYFRNLAVDFMPGESPFRPEAEAAAARNRRTADSPGSHCLPFGVPNSYFNARPFKIYQTSSELAIFYDIDGSFRQIHTDGRSLPKDPLPSWLGYSTGRWERDTLVVDTAGFNDRTWLDTAHQHSEALRVRERFHRRDFGHMDMEVTVEDPKTLTRSVTIKFTELLYPDSDILENFCAEGERDRPFLDQLRK